MKKTKKEYSAPLLTVVSFRVERGFAASGILDQLFLLDNTDEPVRSMEQYEEQENWHSGGDFW